ncbi:phenylalanine--tRNA ligase subunit beta [Alicyclobacillus kakegawensis]|uniref:phenylalanine--tRNA ligase subunit beta n=1 Tax=Alicyclobacillus kakegawensis TaxID=392012 RepID=UPI00082BD206|nr:phenylalanine--tRNA ligase subunit beta [Alicyclobacillus kakegawensis]
MRVSYQWLSEYVDLGGVSPQALADALTSAGIEVESVRPRVERLRRVVVGRVVTCGPHPNADRLKVCTVDVGQDALLTIVCGAPNVAPGQRVPTALVGAELPGGRISQAKLRGVESQGMLCSAKEIGLEVRWLPKSQTEGLYLLPEDAPVGADVSSLLGLDDVILDLSLTPNRSDCLSLRGLAYEVAALLERPLRFLEPHLGDEVLDAGASPVRIELRTPRCPRYEAQVMIGVAGGPSPLWMQMRLLAMGVRPIDVVVDITNYVMLEWGQPLHAFDFDQVRRGTIVVRQAQPGERLATLDGQERVLDEDVIVIADAERAIGIAGVMGGENSEITASTRRVVVESAAFDAASVRRTGQRLGLRSEAQQRFEKGIDPVAVRGALLRARQLLQELAGAAPVGGVVCAEQERPAQPPLLDFSPRRANQLLGTDVAAAEMAAIFRRLGFSVQQLSEEKWQVGVPTRRADIRLEADLVEEIGRIHGYDDIPATLPVGPTTVGMRTQAQRLRKWTRETLAGLGMNEVFTYTLGHPDQLNALRLAEDSFYRKMIPLLRPMSDERIALRTHMLPGLAQVAAYNLSHGMTGGCIFEIGRVYWPRELPLREQPLERQQWAGLWFGEQAVRLWQAGRAYDFYDAKGVLEAWLTSLGLGLRAAFVPIQDADAPWLHPGRAAGVWIDGQIKVGTVGELHPETAQRLGIGGAVYAEFDLDKVDECLGGAWKAQPLPRYPAVRRDLAVLVPQAVSSAQLLAKAAQAAEQAGDILQDCRVFDVYVGPGVPEGQKSVAVAFTYQSDERTLTDEETEAVERAILRAWEQAFGARLRG